MYLYHFVDLSLDEHSQIFRELNMSDEKSRRRFLKTALASAGAAAGLFTTIKFDAADGIKVGRSSVKVGLSEANAVCGLGMGCSGGGGQCGLGMGCGGQ
jgi:hypothetical protein